MLSLSHSGVMSFLIDECLSVDLVTVAGESGQKGSDDDIRRESEFLFRCYSDPGIHHQAAPSKTFSMRTFGEISKPTTS